MPRSSSIRKRARSSESLAPDLTVAAAPSPHRPLATAATIAVFVCIALANLAPIIGNDVHAQIRVGQDILRTGHVPRVDTYSATASGRPFTAHEWLASVLFYFVDSLGGARALCCLQVLVVAGCAALLWRSQPPELRERVFTAPTLLLCSYLVSWRAAVRPHLFSLLALSTIVFAVERWRRSGRLREVLWLIPMQVLWINLHGEAPLGPVILLALASGAAIAASCNGSVLRRYGRKDVLQLAGVATGMLLACLVNPYGWRILPFAGRLLGSDAYMHKLVFEWRPPFEDSALASVHLWAACAFVAVLVLLWAGLALRLAVGPRLFDVLALDAVLAIFATALSLQAIRFVAHAAVLGFPLIARSFEHLARMLRLRAVRRPVAEIALAATLSCGLVFGPGLPAGRDRIRDFRPFGWGYGENTPVEAAQFIRDHAYEGALYDEYSDGAYLLRELAPRVKPVMDSRVDIYGEELTLEFFESQNSIEKFREYLGKYDVTLVLRAFTEPNRGIYETLASDPEWRPVFRTRQRFLFARADIVQR